MYGFISLQQTKKGAKPAGKRGKGKKKSALKYIIDCTHPVEDGIMDVANFVRFLK
jgi:large subunit ribosomal protein L22e